MPPAVKKAAAVVDPYSSVNLADIPFVYLLDRSQWTDFKRALNNCGLTWNLPDWMMTIIYRGPDWQEISSTAEEKARLEELFVAPIRAVGGEEKKIDVIQTSTRFMKLLGYPKAIGEYIQPSSTFCNLKTLQFELDSKLPARQKFWTWIVNSLHGPTTTPGQYHYLRRAMTRLVDLNERLPEQGRVIFSEAYLRTRLIRAARQIPIFKPTIDQMITQSPEIWAAVSVDDLCAKFESVRANDASFVPKRTITAPVISSPDLVSARRPIVHMCTRLQPLLVVASSVEPKTICRV